MHYHNIKLALTKKLIATGFPDYAELKVSEVEQQGFDNRTYPIGDDMLIRMPTRAPSKNSKVFKYCNPCTYKNEQTIAGLALSIFSLPMARRSKC